MSTNPVHVEPLTPREREVLALMARGATNVEIAQELGVRFETVKWHVSNIMSKAGATTRDEAVRVLRPSGPQRFWRAARALLALPATWGVATGAALSVVVLVALAVGLAIREGAPTSSPSAAGYQTDVYAFMEGCLARTDPQIVPDAPRRGATFLRYPMGPIAIGEAQRPAYLFCAASLQATTGLLAPPPKIAGAD